MNKAALAKAIDEAKTGKGRKPKPTQKARKAATAAKKRESQARHGRGPYRLVIAKNNAIYGNLGPYASARAALSDAKTLLRRIAPVKGYALSNVEAQSFVGQTFAGGNVVDGYVVTSRGGPDRNAAAFAVKVGKGSKAAYAADKIPSALRNNGRGRKRRNVTPSQAQVRKVVNLLKINREEGIYRLPVVQIMVDTGLDVDTVTAILTKRLGYDLEPPTGSRAGRGRFGYLSFGHGHRKNPRVSFRTKSGKRVSFMAKKKRNAGYSDRNPKIDFYDPSGAYASSSRWYSTLREARAAAQRKYGKGSTVEFDREFNDRNGLKGGTPRRR
jgi:hypothetical protein